MKAKTYENILKDATTKYDNTIQQVDSNGNLTYNNNKGGAKPPTN